MLENFDKKKALVLLLVLVGVGVVVWIMYLAWHQTTPVTPGNENVPGGGNLPGTGNFNGGIYNGGTNQFPGGGNIPVNGNVPVNGGQINGQPGAEGQVPTIAAGGLTTAPTLTDTPVLSPVGAGSSGARYYNPSDCKFYQASASGGAVPLSEVQYCQVERVTWAPGSQSAILEFPDNAKIIYDFKSGKQFSLPKEMGQFSFSPDGGKIAGKFMGETAADRWIVSVNADGSNLTGIEPMGDNADKVIVAWSPSNQVVAFSRTGEPQGLFQQDVLLIGFNGENFKALPIEGRGFIPKWSGDGKRVLYSVYNDGTDYRPQLFIANGSTDTVGAGKQALNISTWADRCTISDTTAYCAAPQDVPAGAGLAREMVQGVPDNIWRIDLSTGSTTLVGIPLSADGSGISANNISISPDGRFLYFTDAATGQLRSMQLRP